MKNVGRRCFITCEFVNSNSFDSQAKLQNASVLASLRIPAINYQLQQEKMVPQLILLLACLGATDGATVTLTENWEVSDVFPWPASGQFRVSVQCDNNSDMLPTFFIQQNEGSKVYWEMHQNMLQFLNSQTWQIRPLPSRDCNEGDGMMFKVQWIGGEVSVEYKGTVILIRGTVGGAQSDHTWFLRYQYGSGNVTATDDGTVQLQLFIY